LLVRELPQEITEPPAKKASPVTRDKTSAAKAVAPATVTLRHLAAELVDGHDVPKKH
jgi:hypothetical protein